MEQEVAFSLETDPANPMVGAPGLASSGRWFDGGGAGAYNRTGVGPGGPYAGGGNSQ